MNKLKLLIVDDEKTIRYALRRTFGEEYEIVAADNGQKAIDVFESENPDIVLMDIRMPVLNGLSALKIIKQRHRKIPVILMTAFADTSTAMEAMREGAFDYITKPFDNKELRQVVEKAVDAVRLSAKLGCGNEWRTHSHDEECIVGSSPEIIDVCKMIGQVAQSDLPVLLTGETGVGKELAARAIYHNSKRNHASFMVVNCASLPEALIESELFGYESGAFTGAIKQRIGRFEQCHMGTLFLDEIAELPLLAQAKVLRVLQDGTFERLGGNQLLKTDVRIIAATNKHLAEMVQKGLFRSDLYHRINVVSIRIPALRERLGDIPELVRYFIARFGGQKQHHVTDITKGALQKLKSHSWPGNIRELENTLKRAILMAKTNIITEDDFVFYSEASGHGRTFEQVIQSMIEKALERNSDQPYQQVISEVERMLVRKAMDICGGNQVKAAKLLGINRLTLRKKMKIYTC